MVEDEREGEMIYYSKESIELLKKEFERVSPSTWHRIMNPYCGKCLEERGRMIVENGFGYVVKISKGENE